MDPENAAAQDSIYSSSIANIKIYIYTKDFKPVNELTFLLLIYIKFILKTLEVFLIHSCVMFYTMTDKYGLLR